MNTPAPSSDAPRERPARWPFVLLFACLISVGMGQTLMFVILPPIARSLGLSEVQVGAIFAISAVLWVIASPYWGRLSDHWGRRPVILLGLFGYAFSMAAFGLAVQASLSGWLALVPAYIAMIAARAIFGLFGAATVPAAQAYVADRTSAAERGPQLATLGAGFGLGTTLGPGVVALLLALGMIAPFYGIAALGLLSALTVGLVLPERRGRPRFETAPGRMRIGDRRVVPFLILGIALGVCQAIAMQTAGFYAIDVLGMDIGESARWVGSALMGAAAAGLFVQLVIIRILKPAPRTLIGSGAGFGILAFAMLALGNSFPVMFSALVLLGVSFALIRPGTVAGASLAVGAHEQGAVAGLMNTTGAIGVLFAPFVGMSLYQWLPRAPYVLSLALMVAALIYTVLHPAVRGVHAERRPASVDE